MPIIFCVAVFVIIALFFWYTLSTAKRRTLPTTPTPAVPIVPEHRWEVSDKAITELADEIMDEGWFHSKVAGVSFENDDGTSRQEYIEACEPLQPLVLVREPSNPSDPNAVIVYDQQKRQLGYLPRDAARGMKERPGFWTAFVRGKRKEPGEKFFGLVIVLGIQNIKTERDCPHCLKAVKYHAKRCKHCRASIDWDLA